jgi:hypothetical protein
LFFILAAPANILQKIQAIQINFLCGGVKMEKKWALVEWEKIYTPKAYRGLGIKDPRRMSQVLAKKLFWRWLKNLEALWARIWKVKYVRDSPP